MKKATVSLGYPTEARGAIPSFQSIEEEAAFWDSRNLADFMDEADQVTILTAGDLASRLTIRLDETDRLKLARSARQMGVGPSTLVRIWIKEQLSEEVPRVKRRRAS